MNTAERVPERGEEERLPVTVPLERKRARRRKRHVLLLFALLLAGSTAAFALSYGLMLLNGSEGNAAHVSASERAFPFIVAHGHFREYPLPQQDSEIMPPVMDHEGRLWFGEMGQNALAVFDPVARSLRQFTPPHGHSSIMGVQVASDDTVWFAEQDANYIAHYFPASGHFQLYPLPEIMQPDPEHAGKFLPLASAPNELAFDSKGNLWFTEFNADALGWLDTHSGQMRHYALGQPGSILKLAPSGITLDPQGMVWFTEANSDRFGRFDPATGQIRLFSWPGSHTPFKEIASDRQGRLYLTTFTSNLLLSFEPHTATFTPYYTPTTVGHTGNGYGLPDLAVTPAGDVWVAVPAENALARLDIAAHRFIVYPIPTPASLPLGIVIGASQSIWFTEIHKLGMLCLSC